MGNLWEISGTSYLNNAFPRTTNNYIANLSKVIRDKIMSLGRKRLLDDKMQKNICAALEAGANLKIAAASQGISYFTLKQWRSKGKKALEADDWSSLEPGDIVELAPFVDFYIATDEAIAKSSQAMIKTIRDNAVDDWRAAMAALRISGMVRDSDSKRRTTATVKPNENAGGTELILTLDEIFNSDSD